MVAVKPMGHQEPQPPPPLRQEPPLSGRQEPPRGREGEAPTQHSEPYGSAFAAAYAATAAKIDAMQVASQKWMFGLSVGLRRGTAGPGAFPAAPTALDVSITGTPTVGSNLTGVYTFYDEDGSPEGVSTFKWKRDGVDIVGATAKTYALVGADQGRSVSFVVTPVATVAPTTGSPTASPGVHVT